MIEFGQESFDELAHEVAFCIENLRHPKCQVQLAGRFYEKAAECLRAHAILRLLVDADVDGFANDLAMSGQARRGWLRRCERSHYVDYFCALSRSGAMVDAIAADDITLAREIFALSPVNTLMGDEYEDDFCYQRYLGLYITGATDEERMAHMARYRVAARDDDARVKVCEVLDAADQVEFENAFEALLRARATEIAHDQGLAGEEVVMAIGTKIFVEGIAILKLARNAGLAIAPQYPMCPSLALLPHKPAQPPDEFDQP
jgi:hypothetical protein